MKKSKRIISAFLFLVSMVAVLSCGSINTFSLEILPYDYTIAVGHRGLGFIKNDGTLWLSGDGHNIGIERKVFESKGPLGYKVKEPVKVLDDVVSVDLGYLNTYAIKKDGSLWFGEDGFKKVLDDVVFVNTEFFYETLAIKKDRSLWHWGDYIPTGDGNGEISMTPKKIFTDVIYATIAPYYGICAIKSDRSLWYHIGRAPKKLMEDVVLIDANCWMDYPVYGVLKSDGTLWTWGSNNNGQLGDGTNIDIETPKKVMDDVATFSIGEGSILALKNDGTLWTWGDNYMGQLGNGTFTKSNTPQKIMDDVVYAHHESCSCVAIKKDGSVWSWGCNAYGELGVGDTDEGHWALKPWPIRVKISNVKIPSNIILAKTTMAEPTVPSIFVDGKKIDFDAYGIDGYNYFKLRDLAYVLSGSAKQFDVTWDKEKGIDLISNKPYTVVGGEMSKRDTNTRKALLNTSKVYCDGKEIDIKAYTINGYNYFKLRDLGCLFDFGVVWDGATNSIHINTNESYNRDE
ncbi:MAG: hypothetical protein ACOX7H_08580 [Bacillota bacterium]|jgi:hypothetical protein